MNRMKLHRMGITILIGFMLLTGIFDRVMLGLV